MKSENEKSILCETYYRGEGLRMTMDEKIKTSNELERQSWAWMQSASIRHLLNRATF